MPTSVLRRLLAPLCLVLLTTLAATTPAVAARHHRAPSLRVPVASTSSSAPGRIRLSWPSVARATRYRVVWSAKPYGGFLDRAVGGWLPRRARSATLRVGSTYSTDRGQRAVQTALPYGNPVYVRLQARVGHRVRSSAWSSGIFPAAPAPAAGDRIRVGTWNLAGYEYDADHKAAAVASAVRTYGLDVLAVQEQAGTVLQDAATRLGGWSTAGALDEPGQQVMWDPAVFTPGELRVVDVPNYKEARRLVVPCQQLVPRGGGRALWVASPHFVVGAAAQSTQNAWTARDAAVLADTMTRFAGRDPVVVAGDLTSSREPYTVASTGAQQVLVQRGYRDTRTAPRRYGVAYSTLNRGRYPQPASTVGAGSRSDYIMTRGLRGTTIYDNVANQRRPFSDHDLVWSEVVVPTS